MPPEKLGNTRDLFVTDAQVRAMEKALEDLYRYPLFQAAADALNRQLRAGIGDHKLAELVLALREENRLCVIEEQQDSQREPKLICTLGLA